MPGGQPARGAAGIQAALHRIRDIVRQIGDLREIRTKRYAPGLEMVDLDSWPGATPAPSWGGR